MIYHLYKNIVVGGAETLILRLCKATLQRGDECKVICSSVSDVMKKAFEDEKIEIIVYSEWDFEGISKSLSDSDRVYTYTLLDFLHCERFGNKSVHSKVFLYLLDPSALLCNRLIHYGIIKKIVLMCMKKTIYSYIENGNILFMDEVGITSTETAYGKIISEHEDKTMLLPMEDIDFSPEIIKRRVQAKKEQFNILTIARADFPLKGYLIGLIEEVAKLSVQYDNLNLTIITYGKDIQEIYKKVESCNLMSRKCNISIVGETPYDKLEQYYREAHLYIGMGTTVLDAARNGLIAIKVMYNCFEFESSGFFHESPYFLAAEKEFCSEGVDYIFKILNMSDSEYFSSSVKTRKLFEQHYLIDNILSNINGRELKEKKHYINKIIKLILEFEKLFSKNDVKD